MFLLHFIPDALLQWVVNAILLAGLAGIAVTTAFKFFIKYIPAIIPYRTIVQVVSLVLLVAGVYFKGGIGVEMEWRARVAEMEEKVKIAEAKSQQANEDLEKTRKEKVKVIRDTKVIVQEKIVKVAEKIDAECKIGKETTDLLNDAAKGIKK